MRARRSRLAAVVAAAVIALVAGVGSLRAQDAKALSEGLAALREAAADRDAGEAERLFAAFEALGPGDDAHDEARLLVGKTRMAAGRFTEATSVVQPAVDRAASPWSVKCLYLQAEAAARRREWGAAADVYARRVEWAASDLHRGEAAALHREIADGAFTGDVVRDEFGRESKVPDWATARAQYTRVREIQVSEKDAPLVTYRIGKCALETGDPEGARREWTELRERGAGEWADDALYGIGVAYQRLGRPAEARAAFEQVRLDAADGPFAPLALIRIGETWNPVQTRSEEELSRTLGAWREFLRLHPAHEDAADVAWRIGALLEGFGKAREAADAYRDFVRRFPQHERAPVAQDAVARACLAVADFDGAIAEWRVLLERYPTHELWTRAQRAIVEAAFAKGRAAFDEKRDDVARSALEAFLAQYPADGAAGEAQRLLGDLLARASKHAGAVEAWKLVTTKYADQAAAPQAALQIAETHEGPLADLDKALSAYEEVVSRWPGSPQAEQARQVLAQMKGKSLQVRVERPFRTDEEPSAAVTLRNVSRLRLKAYRLRLDEYVRRKGGLAGVEQLETDVVRPDQEWDWEVPEFAKYRLLARACPLPLPKPGAYVVTAAEDELTATFLVLVTDLTVIAKSAPGQALVFVHDERTGEPVEGARVTLLDGGDGVTGADGVWRKDDLAHGTARAVVVGEGPYARHFAFAAGAAPAATAFGYTTKVFLQSDRPVYRPGQSVHLRGIVRRVRDGRYVTEDGLTVRLRVLDPRGAMLVDEDARTDAFGVLTRDLELAAEPALGTYALQADLDGRTFTQTFDVLAYRKPDVLAEVSPAQRAYLTGDTVKATLSLRYAVGGVVAAAPVRWTVFRGPYVFDPSVHEAFSWFFKDAEREAELRRRLDEGQELFTRGEGATDGDGRLEISFATETVDADRSYVIVAEAQDPNRRWIRTSASVPVTTRGLHVICRTEKKVYRPGEAMKLEVTTVDPLHVPVSVEGSAVLVRRRLQAEHWVDDEVARVPAKSGADGRAEVELKAAKAGDHVLRFVARDARGNEVSGAADVTVSGDAEDLAKQARLVADREFYREGDVAKVFVNVPVAPAPVLLTYEGERVLEYRILRATERAQTIDVPLRAEHAPNVFLRMAVAKGGRLHEDGDEVAVFQYLDVKVSADPPESRPGGKVTVHVLTTDQSGKPVRAEVGVDVVDAAIHQIAPDATPQIKPFFYDQRRTHGVATSASVGALPSVTRPTNKDLLFEQMRRLGKERFEAMQEHVRLGRELFQAGEVAKAAEELRKALEIAPANHEARVLLDSIADLRRQAEDKAQTAARGPATPGAPPAAKPGASADAPFEGPASEGTIGVGGGAGGRAGGVRRLRAAGGGKKSAEPEKADSLKDAEMDLAADVLLVETNGRVLESWSAVAASRVAQFGDLPSLGYLLRAEGDGAAALVPPELRSRFADTARAALVATGDDGTATLEVELPDNLTEWKVNARGASAGPLVGEGATRFRTVKRLLVRPDAPRFLVAGDTTTPAATIHSSLGSDAEVTVRFSAEGATVSGESERTVTVRPGEVRPFDARVDAPDHGLAKLRVDALTSVESDAAQVALPVLPFGLSRIDGASGLLVEEAFASLDLPERVVPGTQSVTVTLSPSIDLALLESLAYVGRYPWGCVEQTVNRFLPALAARKALGDAGSPNARLAAMLDDQVQRGLVALYALQNDDGSFGWFGARSPSDATRGGGSPEMTAYGVLGMVRAEQHGYRVSVPNRDRAVQAAKNLLRGASGEDRAFLLYALSFAGQADLDALNALQRERTTLRPRGLALLALAMHRSGRPSNAAELVQLLATRVVREDGQAHWDGDVSILKAARIAPPYRDAEPTAYALLALLATEPRNELIDEAAAWLVASRRGPLWRSTRDTAAAIEALAEHARGRGVERAECEVGVYVNDQAEPVEVLRFGGGARPVDAPVSVEVPAAALRPGANRIVLRKQGPGRVHWSALLAAVEAPAEGKGIEAGSVLLSVARGYTEWFRPRLPGELAEERIVPGWTVVVPEKRPAWDGRPLRTAGTSDKVQVTLTLTSREPVSNVIVEDRLPAGCEVVSGSAEGAFDREERRDDRQVFFLARVHGTTRLSYVLQAIHPGVYRALPATARAMYEPEVHGWTKDETFTVTPEPGTVGRGARPEEITPDEVWGLALRAMSRKDWASAREGLEGLRDRYELVPEVLEELWARLFTVGVEAGDAKLTVEAFERMTDRNPRRAPTDVRLRRALADAYRTLGEGERATVLYRDLVRDLYALDEGAAAAFDAIANPWRARDLRLAALRRMPDSSWVEGLELALAGATEQLRAPLAAPDGARRPPSSEAQPLLLGEAVRMYRAFQAHHADSPLAHEAGYRAVQTLLRMELGADAVREGSRFRTRHAQSRYLDDVTLLVAQGHFQAGAYDDALQAANALLAGKFPSDGDPAVLVDSPFRSQAVHLAAKVAHLRGDLARAVDLYRQVSGLFPDAADAERFLTEKGLELREVESCPVGTTPVLHLRRKNVPDVALEAYAVDFMMLYALRRNLAEVNRIDLSGIEPARRWSVARKGAEDFRWNEAEVELPAKEKGVYLVTARADGLFASSVVLVSDLQVDVQAAGGRLRIYTTNRGSGAPWGEVYVKVGDGAAIQAQGFTDARGVLDVPAVSGVFSVVAEKDGHVALWRP